MRTRCFLASLAFSAVLLTAADWARFRGPNGTGVSPDRDVPVEWTKANVLFRAELPGTGHSSPIVVGKRVFLLSATGSERLVLCHDADTGKELWKKTVPGGIGKTHRKSSLASATPCSDGERLYCVFWDGKKVGLYAYDLDGKLLWDKDLGAFKSQHGPGFSPVVVDGRVIVNNDQDGKAVLQAFDAKTGTPAWQVTRTAFRACYSTPIVHEQGAAGKELIVTSTAGVTAYDPATGKQVWHYTWSFPASPLRTVGSSVIESGLVFACSGDGRGDRAMIAVKLGGKGDVSRTNLAWTKEKGTPYVPTLLARDGHLYGVNDTGTVFCYKAATGEEVWQGRLAGNVSASPVMVGGNVYVFDEKGDTYVVEASPAGLKRLAKNSLGDPVVSSPAVANGRLYVRTTKHLVCVGKPAGGR